MKELYQRIYLTHANHKRKIHCRLGAIAFFEYSEKTAATLVYTIAGVVPVVESPDEINLMLDKLAKQGETDV